MQAPLQITSRDIDHSEALEAHIRGKVEKLEEFFKHIISCRAMVEVPHKHHHQGKQFNARRLRGDIKTHEPGRMNESNDMDTGQRDDVT